MKKRTLIFLSVALFSLAIAMTVSGIVISKNDNLAKFDRGVKINGVSVAGRTTDEATQLVLAKIKKQIDDIDIKIIYKDKIWQFSKDDFQIDEGVKNVVNNVFKTTKLTDKKTVEYIATKTGDFQTALKDVFVDFDKKIDEIAKEIDADAQDAFVEFDPNAKQMFQVVDAKQGIKVDKQRLVQDIERQFANSNQITVYVHTDVVEPKVTKSYFDDKLNLQSKFSTSIKGSTAGRRNNVTVAMQKINGTVVKPNQIVSFNELTSPQDASGGYQDAIIILNGKFVNGMGGGLCQASTTLYNACVLANLQILEVHKHTLPVHYVELALDAMISNGYADMIFKNNSDDDIYIKSYVAQDDAVVEIYGKSIPDGVTIKRVSEIVKTLPHSGDKVIADANGEYSSQVLYKGEYYRLKWPSEGHEAKAYKEYYKDGRLIGREEIRHETYQPEQGIVIEGTQDLPQGLDLPKQDVYIIKPQKEQ